MGAGGPGDHPLTDLVVHRKMRFPKDICILLETIHSHDLTLLKRFDLEFFVWADSNNLNVARIELLEIINKNKIKPTMEMLSQKEALSRSRCLYSQALMQEDLKKYYFELSKHYLLFAESKGEISASYGKQKMKLLKENS